MALNAKVVAHKVASKLLLFDHEVIAHDAGRHRPSGSSEAACAAATSRAAADHALPSHGKGRTSHQKRRKIGRSIYQSTGRLGRLMPQIYRDPRVFRSTFDVFWSTIYRNLPPSTGRW